jgi:hypothetical protein
MFSSYNVNTCRLTLILILSSHLRLGRHSDLFCSLLPNIIAKEIPNSLICATLHTYLILSLCLSVCRSILPSLLSFLLRPSVRPFICATVLPPARPSAHRSIRPTKPSLHPCIHLPSKHPHLKPYIHFSFLQVMEDRRNEIDKGKPKY